MKRVKPRFSPRRPKHGLAHTLYRHRLNQNKTQVELAEEIGVHDVTLRSWETGHTSPQLYLTEAWANALGFELYIRQRKQPCLTLYKPNRR